MLQLTKSEALELLREHRSRLLTSEAECVMCALAGGAEPANVIYESEYGVVSLDRFGARAGHLLVIAREHVERVTAMSLASYLELQRLVFAACGAVESVFRPKRTFVAALGASNPLLMSYPHYHVHVVPVCDDDERARPAAVFSWSQGVVSYDASEAANLVRELRAAWSFGSPLTRR
jgi:diadenosine tetraphosphate (Ap4A) HIT family hydrolase